MLNGVVIVMNGWSWLLDLLDSCFVLVTPVGEMWMDLQENWRN
jgi:hypothetical protein